MDAAQQKQTQSKRPARIVNQLKTVLWVVCGMGVTVLVSLYFMGALESESARFRRLLARISHHPLGGWIIGCELECFFLSVAFAVEPGPVGGWS